MAVPGEQESFKSQSFSAPKRAPVVSSGPPEAGKRLAAERQQTREKFFDNRQDVSSNRLDRRLLQDQLYEEFKADPTKTKLVKGSSNLYQAATPGGKLLAEKQMELANKYGPTFSEIASDVTYAGGKLLGALGERAMSGGLGFFGAIKGVANYALDKANKGYDKLNPVQQEIFDNPNKYPFASNISSIDAVNSAKNLALEAQRDVLGLEALAASEPDATGIPAIGGGGGFDEKPSDLFGRGSLPVPKIDVETPNYVESGQLKKDLQKSGILSVDDPSTQEPLPDSTKIPGEEQFGTTIGDLKRVMKEQGFNDLQIQSTVNQVTQQILSGDFTGDVEVETGSTTRGSELPNLPGGGPSTGTQVTAYNNPVNLMDVGQAGATGETYGNNFAVFPDAQTGIMAAKRDLAIKTERYGGNVDEIIGEFSPRSDNPDSFDNYVNFVKQGVGDTVDPGEEDELLRRVIQFENKPEIANQYLAMVADGGMIDKELTNLQNGLQNMYNGIPSVRRR